MHMYMCHIHRNNRFNKLHLWPEKKKKRKKKKKTYIFHFCPQTYHAPESLTIWYQVMLADQRINPLTLEIK